MAKTRGSERTTRSKTQPDYTTGRKRKTTEGSGDGISKVKTPKKKTAAAAAAATAATAGASRPRGRPPKASKAAPATAASKAKSAPKTKAAPKTKKTTTTKTPVASVASEGARRRGRPPKASILATQSTIISDAITAAKKDAAKEKAPARGRGSRKAAEPEAPVQPPKRGRKPAAAAATTTTTTTTKPAATRGRPAKRGRSSKDEEPVAAPKKAGRPKKVEAVEETPAQPAPKKGGRPKKTDTTTSTAAATAAEPAPAPRRGRPPRQAEDPTSEPPKAQAIRTKRGAKLEAPPAEKKSRKRTKAAEEEEEVKKAETPAKTPRKGRSKAVAEEEKVEETASEPPRTVEKTPRKIATPKSRKKVAATPKPTTTQATKVSARRSEVVSKAKSVIVTEDAVVEHEEEVVEVEVVELEESSFATARSSGTKIFKTPQSTARTPPTRTPAKTPTKSSTRAPARAVRTPELPPITSRPPPPPTPPPKAQTPKSTPKAPRPPQTVPRASPKQVSLASGKRARTEERELPSKIPTPPTKRARTEERETEARAEVPTSEADKFTVLEKGLLWFFSRAREGHQVRPGVENRDLCGYLVMQPTTAESLIGAPTPIAQGGNLRVVMFPQPEFNGVQVQGFVAAAGASLETVREVLSQESYTTEKGVDKLRPTAQPIGAAVYAISRTDAYPGRSDASHIAYVMVRPRGAEGLTAAQKVFGLSEKGGFSAAVLNPQVIFRPRMGPRPPFTAEILQEMNGNGQVSLRPEHLDYLGAQLSMAHVSRPNRVVELPELEELARADVDRVSSMAAAQKIYDGAYVDLGLGEGEWGPELLVPWE